MKRKFFAVFLSLCMVMSLVPMTALAAEESEPITVTNFSELQGALEATEDSVIQVSGNIEMTDSVIFENKVTLELTETANITYTSDTCSQLYLIMLQGGSTLKMAQGSSVTMNGDADSQDANRDWRAVYSNGDMTVEQFEGSITINNARGRALYANNDLVFNCPMAGTVTMNNQNGDNRYVYGICSHAGDIIFNQGIAETGKVTVDFGGGNNGYGIIAQSGNVTIKGDMAGEIDVQLGTSHAGIGIYAAQNVTIDSISGSVYARGGSSSGYAIYAAGGDVAIGSISGTVTGDCYNKIMENSQSDASAIYARGSIYGSKDAVTGKVTPIQLSGTLSSTVGRNDAYTVNAGGDIHIHILESGSIKAQSSFGASFGDLDDSYEPMSNNWGGAAAGAVADGTIHITSEGDVDRIEVISRAEDNTAVDSKLLVDTGKLSDVEASSSFLYYVARGNDEAAKEALESLTEGQKDLITGLDDIVAELYTVRVTNAGELTNALANAVDGTIIVLTPGTYEGQFSTDNAVTIRGEDGARVEHLAVSSTAALGTVRIENVTFFGASNQISADVSNAGLYIYSGTSIDKVEIVDCVFELNPGSVTTGGEGQWDPPTSTTNIAIVTGNAKDVTVEGCTVDGYTMAGYHNPTADDTVRYLDNTIQNTTAGIGFIGTDNVVVTGNTFDNAYGIRLEPDWSTPANLCGEITFEENKFINMPEDAYALRAQNSSGTSGVAEDAVLNLGYNYWGSADPDFDRLILAPEGQEIVVEPYYKEATMRPEDLNTYRPPVVVPPANPNYKITIGAMENGTVTANPTAAKAGATVTLTATPDEGYALSTLTVTDRFGDAVRVTEQADGTYTFTMPNGQVTVNATFVETEEPVAEPFVDVAEGDWFYDAVVYAYQNELMDGVGGNRFAPNSETTRAQLVTILYRLEGQPAVSGDLPFTDVETGIWYTDAILWAAQNNIVNGVSDTEFAPGDDLTRQQLVTILYRYAESKGYDVSASADLSGYPDADQVQDYAQPAMAWAVAENIIQGMEDGTLKPAGNASRAQIATILMRFCEDVAQ